MLTPEQIDAIFTEAHNADGSRGFRYIVARAIYAQALKDAADACKAAPVPESCNAIERALWAVAAEEHAAAILALGKE